jgi:hypothetical protein
VSVRVERLRAITENDARAEGVEPISGLGADQRLPHPEGASWGRTSGTHPYTVAFACLWDKINADRGYPWINDPWVWAVTFRKVGALLDDGAGDLAAGGRR